MRYSRSTLLVSRYVLAVTKAPWYSVLYHAGTVLVCVADIGYLLITGALLVKANPPDYLRVPAPSIYLSHTSLPTN